MSSGSVVDDRQHVVGDACNSLCRAGFYFDRYWSGTNQAGSYIPKYNTFGARPPKRARKYDEHPYSMHLLSIYAGEGLLYKPSPQQPCGYAVGKTIGAGNPTDYWNSNDDIYLLQSLRRQIEGTDFNALLFLGTADESLRTIFDGAHRIAKAVTQLKRFNFSGAAKILTSGTPRERRAWSFGHSRSSANAQRASKDASSNWLELQYGWLPLLSDVYDGAGALASTLSSPIGRRVRARRTRNGTGLTLGSSSYTADDMKHIIKGQYVAYIKEVDTVSLLGLKDPSSLVWERLPWSFVADWFIPIQDYLQARALTQSVSGTFVKTITEKRVVKGFHYESGGYHFDDPGYYGKYVKCNRYVYTSLPDVPLPRFKPLGDVPSWKRALNAVSLLVQKVF